MKNRQVVAVFYAILAAVFYSLNTPISKRLLGTVPPTWMAGLLYLGAGIGVGIMYLFHRRSESPTERLGRGDLKYTVGMIVLDIAAPILLMLGLSRGTASNASLLGNFEIVATALIALLLFRERVSRQLWVAIGFITLSGIVLSFEGGDSLRFSTGSLLVLGATVCWGLENNCTRSISERSTYQIVTLKGLGSGIGSCMIAALTGERLPMLRYIGATMLLGFVAYGLSIFTYIRAQRDLGAAKTSAYYAVAPFIAAFLSFAINREPFTGSFACALLLMVIGTVFVISDTLVSRHRHTHLHTIRHTHGGSTHTHEIAHEHAHAHLPGGARHVHLHAGYMHSDAHRRAHESERPE